MANLANKKINPLMERIKEEFPRKLQLLYSVSPEEASDKQVYHVLSSIIVEILGAKRQSFINHTHSVGGKQIYYLSMEFLMGRSLKTSLYNLELADDIKSMLKQYDINLDKIYEYEPDAGLGNGGLGRLAACYLDGLATCEFPAMGTVSSSRSLRTAGRQSFPITGSPAVRYGSCPSPSLLSTFTSRATFMSTGTTDTTIFPM